MTPSPKGDLEYRLRQRFKGEWDALTDDEAEPFFRRACAECRCDPDADLGEDVERLLNGYAWTLFAESLDPAEAKRIASFGFKTASDLVGATDGGGMF